jgi:hypothetical protein
MEALMRLRLLCLAVVSVAGCAGDTKPEPATARAACPPGKLDNGQHCVDAPAPAPAPADGAAANPAAAPLSPPLPSATQVDVALVTPLLAPFTQQFLVPGARPLGPALAGQFEAGQALERSVQLQPGKCYTVVGVGAPSVQNLDIWLVPPSIVAGVASPILAQDQTQGQTAVLGPAPNCFHWAAPLAAPMRVVMAVTAGAGLAGAQIYEK